MSQGYRKQNGGFAYRLMSHGVQETERGIAYRVMSQGVQETERGDYVQGDESGSTGNRTGGLRTGK